ncbi:ubiquitin-conjugating enzyme E2C-binding protein [Xylariomycetidae sp. FL2044]|nr:ubiquitin-conjugating enzyme E2C-binding protein [Xylariomycetidae sp. FL2044]
MPAHPILIYAELLSNIRQVSVACSLPTPSSDITRASVNSDGLRLTVTHDGLERSLELPSRVAVRSQLPISSQGSKTLSWRLPLASIHKGPQHAVFRPENAPIPWSASDLEAGAGISCRTCKSDVVRAGTLKTWKDLPSENWAEMMEFWHCHKPHDHIQEDDDHLTSRGYGASSRISAQPGVGFVDLTSFLLSKTDVSESAISMPSSSLKPENSSGTPNRLDSSPELKGVSVRCRTCNSDLGIIHEETFSTSLYKWQVAITRQRPTEESKNAPTQQPSLSHCLSAMLLATMARSACSKTILLPITRTVDDDHPPSLLHIWLFSYHIAYASTEAPRSSPARAVKVFFRMVSRAEADGMLDSMTADVQDITLPGDAIAQVEGLLARSNTYFDEGNRRFKEWNVGLLEKWEGKDGVA